MQTMVLLVRRRRLNMLSLMPLIALVTAVTSLAAFVNSENSTDISNQIESSNHSYASPKKNGQQILMSDNVPATSSLSRLNFLVLNQTLEKIVQSKNIQRLTTPSTSKTTPATTTTKRIIQTVSSYTSTETTTAAASTTSTTTTSTSTTTSAQIVRLIPQISEFRLTAINYEPRTIHLMITYLLRTNLSSTLLMGITGNRAGSSFQVAPAHVDVDIECRSSEFEQVWTRLIRNQSVSTHYVSSSTHMMPRSEPKPGSFVRCNAQAVDSLDPARPPLTSSINLLIEPAAASNLFMKRVNETSIELVWMSPAYFYDYLEANCYLDEERLVKSDMKTKISERLYPSKVAAAHILNSNASIVASSNRHTLTGLISGAIYNCTLTTVRSVLNYTTRAKSDAAFQMTVNHDYRVSSKKLRNVCYDDISIDDGDDENESGLDIGFREVCTSEWHANLNLFDKKLEPSRKRGRPQQAAPAYELSEPILKRSKVDEKEGLVEIELQPPSGFYDQYTVNLIELMPVTNNSILFSKNFTVISQNTLRLDFLILNTPETLKSGGRYEITATVQRRVSRALKFNQVKSSLKINSFYIRPEPIRSVLYFVKSNTSANLTWQQPLLGIYKLFSVKYYVQSAPDAATEQRTTATWIYVQDLRPAHSHIVEVKSCADELCKISSEAAKFTLDLSQKQVLKEVSVSNSSSDSAASLRINWRLLPETESDVCDLGYFRLNWLNVKRNESRSTLIEAAQLCPDLKCGQVDSISVECKYELHNLDFNTDYSIALAIVSLSGGYEWPASSIVRAKTHFTIPKTLKKTMPNYDMNANILSPAALSIIEPQIDDSTGPILNTRLYLVKLGSLKQQTNRSEMFTLVSMIDQDYLRQMMNLSSECSNATMLLEPCLLQSQPYAKSKNEKIVLIGNLESTENATVIFNRTIAKGRKTNTNKNSKNSTLDGNNLMYSSEYKFEYEHINTSLIETSSAYQLFYVFEIGDNRSHALLFATEPSEPIQTRSIVSTVSAASSEKRDKLTLWIVVGVCVLSSLFLVGLIATLIVLTFVKYRPSKFHKAAQIAGANGAQSQQVKFVNGALMNTPGAVVGINAILRSKFDRSDDFLGGSLEFVPPVPFSRNDMTNIWLMKHANGDLILDEEYRNLPDYRDIKSSHASQDPKNECKNRFLDIKAYDESRVVLHVNGGVGPSVTNGGGAATTTAITTTTVTTKSNGDLSASSSSSSSSTGSPLSASISSGLSRVSHVGVDNDDNGDYINANFVQGYSHEKKFIATQGPKKETLTDFWRMIYQYRVSAIVMLTKLVEKGVERCTQYWPDKLNLTESYGDYDVTMKDQQKCGDYIKRIFDLVYTGYGASNTAALMQTPGSMSMNRARNGGARQVLTVTQYYYPEWPDKETPSTDPISILTLIRDVNAAHLPYQYPIVVHCSAGVGRTGTYITLDAMMDRIEHEGTVDIFGFISKIRERRQYLVQTTKQYIFIHEALYEYCLYGFTDIDVSHLVSHFKSLKERTLVSSVATRQSNKTKLELEFDRLCSAFVPNMQAREAFRCENKSKNRNLNMICYDENRVKLSSLTGSSYINATRIKGFDASIGLGSAGSTTCSSLTSSLSAEMLITQDPMSSTLFEFWKMITEYECNIIVALNKEFEKEKESVYWPNEEESVRSWELEDTKFIVQLLKSSNSLDSQSKSFTRREFEIISHKYSGTARMTVTHFLLNEQWSEDRAPPNRSAFLDLVGQVQKAVAKYDHSTRIAVHAHGGGSNCSVFCALNILLDQFKNDQIVDVCRTVKKLKTQRPNMIETYEQYEFLYQCLVDFIDMFGIYSQSTFGSFHSHTSLNNDESFKSPNAIKDPKSIHIHIK